MDGWMNGRIDQMDGWTVGEMDTWMNKKAGRQTDRCVTVEWYIVCYMNVDILDRTCTAGRVKKPEQACTYWILLLTCPGCFPVPWIYFAAPKTVWAAIFEERLLGIPDLTPPSLSASTAMAVKAIALPKAPALLMYASFISRVSAENKTKNKHWEKYAMKKQIITHLIQ